MEFLENGSSWDHEILRVYQGQPTPQKSQAIINRIFSTQLNRKSHFDMAHSLCCQRLITKSSVEEVVLLQPAMPNTIDKVKFKGVNCLRNEK